MANNHYLLCGTLPDVFDFRFLYDIARLSKAITSCNPSATVQTFSRVEPFWHPIIQPITQTLQQISPDIATEVDYSNMNLQPPEKFLNAIESLDVKNGDYVFIHMTNHGSTSAFAITKTDYLSFKDLEGPLQAILDKGARVLFFVSACGSRSFARPLNEEFCKKGAPLSIFTDDPAHCTSANISLNKMPSVKVGTEFTQAFLSFLSNWKLQDAHTVAALADFMPKKFHAFLGSNKSDDLRHYFGKIDSFVSPLVRSGEVQYVTIHPFNGDKADHRGIGAELKGLLKHILGRPLQDSDLNIDVDELVAKHMKEIVALLKILSKERFIIPGQLEGGNAVYLLVLRGINPDSLVQKIKEFRAIAPTDPLKRWESFEDSDDSS